MYCDFSRVGASSRQYTMEIRNLDLDVNSGMLYTSSSKMKYVDFNIFKDVLFRHADICTVDVSRIYSTVMLEFVLQKQGKCFFVIVYQQKIMSLTQFFIELP